MNFKHGFIELFEILWNFGNICNIAVFHLDFVDNFIRPKSSRLQVVRQELVYYDEVTAVVSLHIHVFIDWLNGWSTARNV